MAFFTLAKVGIFIFSVKKDTNKGAAVTSLRTFVLSNAFICFKDVIVKKPDPINHKYNLRY